MNINYKHYQSLCSLNAALMLNNVSISIYILSKIKEEGNVIDKKTTRLKPLLTPKHEYYNF